MPRSIVHLKSRNADGDIARGMSWPLGASAIAQALHDPSTPEIWLDVFRRDRIKEWSRTSPPRWDAERLNPDQPVLVEVKHDKNWIRRQFDMDRRSGGSNPKPWMRLNPSPFVEADVYSLPANVVRTAGLTRARTTEVLQSALSEYVPSPLTTHEWRITLSLDRDAKQLIVTRYERPIREWTLVHQVRNAIKPD